ncbi:Protein kinase family protein [Prunus dulcis]|uniref:Protein kinase family protein n=1 Tax=Prunus dulcis TaxID=3755 RepID=A0A5H2XSS4_PRUDU|nr:Protein kinase family protein [Prunus dulcis]
MKEVKPKPETLACKYPSVEMPLALTNFLRVEIFHSSCNLKHQINCNRKRKWKSFSWATNLFDVAAEVSAHQFHNEKTLFLFLIRKPAKEVHYVGVGQR